MWRDIFDNVRQLIRLKEQTEQNTADIAEMREELKALGLAVRDFTYEVQRIRENEAHEREKMALRLENVLLQFERRLPPPRN